MISEIGDTAPLGFVKSHYANFILLHIISLICAQRLLALSFYRTNLQIWYSLRILSKSETGQEIISRTSDTLGDVTEQTHRNTGHQRHLLFWSGPAERRQKREIIYIFSGVPCGGGRKCDSRRRTMMLLVFKQNKLYAFAFWMYM